MGSSASADGRDMAAGTTRALHSAMQGEAGGHAEYLAFAREAEAAGNDAAATAFEAAAHDELRHFTAVARMTRLVGTDLANLEMSVQHLARAVGDYGDWADEADRADCAAAAELFQEIQSDMAGHLAAFSTAMRAIVDPDVDMPEVPAAEPVDVTPGDPACSRSVNRNLHIAMKAEALAGAGAHLYANAARDERPELAELFMNAAHTYVHTHYAQLGNVAGAFGDTAANLRAGIADESADLRAYARHERAAARAGDYAAARLFRQLQRDETRHRAAFQEALAGLTPTPDEPPIPGGPTTPPPTGPTTPPAGPTPTPYGTPAR